MLSSFHKSTVRVSLLGFIVAAHAACAGSAQVMVAAKVKPGGNWTNFPTRTLASLPAEMVKTDSGFSRYGGLLARKVNATGFFYATNLNGRWWLVDPDGCLYLNKGVCAVSPIKANGEDAALKRKFGTEAGWASGTISLLHSNGFNGVGAWSDTVPLRTARQPIPYTRIWNFMSSYGQKRGGTYQLPGHIGYPKDCIFVFDPDFEKFCDSFAKRLAESKSDPWLLGHFSDNEMPFKRDALRNYLQLPEDDPGRKAALAWLQARHGKLATEKDITEQDRKDFLALVTERYYRIVSAAIKKYDPNHLYLGSRFHGGEVNYPEVFRAAGPYVDVVAVNYYRVWTPSQDKLAMWSRESGKPIVITEWYVKGEDSGLPNNSGAGWIVKTQADRGAFYQHFTLGLLESKVCVGWHWFKYSDNDPSDKNAEPSNRDSNKGIVTIGYETYPELLQAMKALNDRAYSLADYFDGRGKPLTAQTSAGTAP